MPIAVRSTSRPERLRLARRPAISRIVFFFLAMIATTAASIVGALIVSPATAQADTPILTSPANGAVLPYTGHSPTFSISCSDDYCGGVKVTVGPTPQDATPDPSALTGDGSVADGFLTATSDGSFATGTLTWQGSTAKWGPGRYYLAMSEDFGETYSAVQTFTIAAPPPQFLRAFGPNNRGVSIGNPTFAVACHFGCPAGTSIVVSTYHGYLAKAKVSATGGVGAFIRPNGRRVKWTVGMTYFWRAVGPFGHTHLAKFRVIASPPPPPPPAPVSLACRQAHLDLLNAQKNLQWAIAFGGDVPQAQLNVQLAQREVQADC